MLGIGISFASFRRFWAAAARRNSSRAALFAEKQVVESGGLMAYGASIPASFRRAAAMDLVAWCLSCATVRDNSLARSLNSPAALR